jgi:flagellar biogenesis protein FliO
LITDFDIITIKMITSLIIIVTFIILLFFLLRRIRLSPLSDGKLPDMRVLGTLNLAPKRAIALVEICEQWLIVGIGTENVSLISKIDTPPKSNATADGNETNKNRFQSILENFGLNQKRNSDPGKRENAGT